MLTSSILDNRHLSLLWGGATSIPDGILEVWSMVNHSCQILNSSTIKFVLLPKDLDIRICESKYASEVVSGFGHRVPSDFLSQVSASPFLTSTSRTAFLTSNSRTREKNICGKTLELFSFFLLVTSFIKLYQRHNEP